VNGLPGDGAASLAAQRQALLRMRRDGKLSNETINRILRELDLEESRLET
jgi:monovalent cation/hydrogen antiporter